MLNEASNPVGELMGCMRWSVWPVNLPALYQHDKQQHGMTEGPKKLALRRPFELHWPENMRLAKTESLPFLPFNLQ